MRLIKIVFIFSVVLTPYTLCANEEESGNEVSEIVVRAHKPDDPCRINLIASLYDRENKKPGFVGKTNYNNMSPARESGSMLYTAKCEGVPDLYWHDKRCKNTKFNGLKAWSDSVKMYREEGEQEIVFELTEDQSCDRISKGPQHADNYQNIDCGLREFNYRKQYTVSLADIWDARNERINFSCHEKNCKVVILYNESNAAHFLLTRKDSRGNETTKLIINNAYNSKVDFESDEPDPDLRQCYPD